MRIAEMRVTPIAIVDPPLLNAAGLHAPYALRTVVELITDSNVTGVGEVTGSAGVTQALEDARKLVVGMNPFELTKLRFDLKSFLGDAQKEGGKPWDKKLYVHALSALDVACYDVIGKETGRPVVDLLGGKVRDRVQFSAYLFYKHKGAGGELGFDVHPRATGWQAAREAAALDPEGIVAQAKAMCAEFGFKSIKLKGGVMEPDREVDAILALREAFGPNVPLRIDPNAAWSYETALKCAKRLEGVLEYLEDPTGGQEDMARLRANVHMSLATNMCTTSFDDLPSSIRLHSEDIILADHHFWGGLKESSQLGRICETFGRALSMHSNSHLGVSLAAMTHLAASQPMLTYDVDTHYPWQSEEIIKGGRFKFEEGALEVSTEPGLGVELDHEAVGRLHENYVRCGITHRDDEIEMQKVEPEWKFRAPRW